jgi:hypothetical protein
LWFAIWTPHNLRHSPTTRLCTPPNHGDAIRNESASVCRTTRASMIVPMYTEPASYEVTVFGFAAFHRRSKHRHVGRSARRLLGAASIRRCSPAACVAARSWAAATRKEACRPTTRSTSPTLSPPSTIRSDMAPRLASPIRSADRITLCKANQSASCSDGNSNSCREQGKSSSALIVDHSN